MSEITGESDTAVAVAMTDALAMTDAAGITDVSAVTETIAVAETSAVAETTEARVLDAVVACAGRWGIDKTTVDDVAREAGVSRATVYRLFPGGKTAMVHLTTDREAVTMLVEMADRVDGCGSLPESLVELLTSGTAILAEQPAIAYMRTHEPATLRRFFSFRHLDRLLGLTADVLGPSLHGFLDPDAAREAVEWLARLAISYFLNPEPGRDLADRTVAAAVVRNHLMPGLDQSRCSHRDGLPEHPTGAPVQPQVQPAPEPQPTNQAPQPRRQPR